MAESEIFPGRSFSAFLFDMDGTILTSLLAAERVWTRWAMKHGVDVPHLMATLHGKRSIDTVRSLAIPGMDAVAEADAITQAEIEDVEGVEAIPGVGDFLAALPRERWAIVTSAPRDLALARIAAARLPLPELMIASEDVPRGKPAPDPYLIAAGRLGFQATDCLVFEDAPAGIQAGEHAGASIVVISATHASPAQTPHPRFADYHGLAGRPVPGGLGLFGV
ncbi:HAD-IA family hydrolase [Kaistia algarum]|uniref:HAD-IA family hydrolase n=1 Tax=Kaistia algarum TaxID=2083279 RepID=UPI001A9C431C|nr:HAD-IA family hydrolase [Kaistia algarum]MCX5515856.1 HAD-IA family hydrolase [Kaistia algarum]